MQCRELEGKSVIAFFAPTAADGKTYQFEGFNLYPMISIGYLMNSKHRTHRHQYSINF